MSRSGRLIILVLALLLFVLLLVSCGDGAGRAGDAGEHRVLILGVDGMDPDLLGEMMQAGRMPNFSALAALGGFVPLGTSAPPQSPVAWSNFIAGADPGTHQIFDFIHRDPDPPGKHLVVLPYLSTSTVEPPARDWSIPIGGWRIPLFGSSTVSLRRGGAFWNDLAAHGIETTIYRVPANYPPPVLKESDPFQCLCGMGTPDLLGTYGEFTLFTPDVPAIGRSVGGGRFEQLWLHQHRGAATLTGPYNFLRAPDESARRSKLTVDFDVVRDPEEDVARITIGNEIVLLNAGEWSDWVPVSFETNIPGSWLLRAAQLPTSMHAMVRFFLKQVHPKFELYVTPLNIDPLDPVNPIGAPGSFPDELAEACGRYYTTGIPEDTKALRSGALNEDEFLSQVSVLKQERFRQYRYALERFERGCLFFYFGHIDQLSHIFWRDRDPDHPAHDANEAVRYGGIVEDLYIEIDGLLGEAMAGLDEADTIIVMSDHGFTSFRRGFNLNTWLIENRYMAVTDPAQQDRFTYLSNVDWTRTHAYALGLNGLYVNLIGREKAGIVPPGERAAIIEEIAGRLRALRDADGSAVIDTVYVVDDYYPGADPDVAPDILVGYADTYRASWATSQGGIPRQTIEDNHDRWSGDHCIAHEIVPGILVTNRSILPGAPNLTDLAPTILDQFGIDAPPEMTGRVVFERMSSSP